MAASLIEVTFPPGSASAAHRHPGFVLGYVLEGQFRFAVNGEAERVLGPGDTFYEPIGAVHSTAGNAEANRPARILAFMVAPEGQPVAKPL